MKKSIEGLEGKKNNTLNPPECKIPKLKHEDVLILELHCSVGMVGN